MKCTSCHAELPDGARFCGSCGATLSGSPVCRNCGTEMELGARFCGKCGSPQGAGIASPPAAPGLSPSSRQAVERGSGRGGSAKPLLLGLAAIVLVGLAGMFILSSSGSGGDSFKPVVSATNTPGSAAQVARATPASGQVPVALQPTSTASSSSPSQPGPQKAEFKAPDSSGLIQTKDWGEVPANQIGIVLKEGLRRPDAEMIAQRLGATVVGELTYIDLYQLEFAGKTEADLVALLGKAKATSGVDLAFPVQQAFLDVDIKGVRCDPFKDSVYDGTNATPYKMIGVDAAWQILRASGVDLSPVKVGIADDGLYRGKGEFSGATKFETPDKEDALAGPLKDSGGTEDPKGSHGTAVASILGADPDNGGITGVASVLGDKMSVTMTNVFGKQFGGTTETKADPNDPTKYTSGGKTYAVGPLVALKKQVDAGATIVNCSWGNSNAHPDLAKAYRRFFEKMAKDHPNVLFVCSAGNNGQALDGSKRYPSGASLPNMITVGNVDNDGSRWSSSNMAGKDFEVTLGAPGHRVPSGRGADGKISNEYGGTSFATPQVTAAAAMLRSINPKLTAADIKRILVETAATETDVSGKKVAVDASVGGRVLRVDSAVLRVINDLRAAQRPPLAALKPEDLQKIATIDAVAQGKSLTDYTIKVTLGGVFNKATEVSIQLSGPGAIGGESKKRASVPGEVTWGFSLLKPQDEASLLIHRLDNGACVRVRIKPQPVLEGKWTGASTLTDVAMPGLEEVPPEMRAQIRSAMGIGQSFPFEVVFREETPESGIIIADGAGGKVEYRYTFKDGQLTVNDWRFTPIFTESRFAGQLKQSGNSFTIEGSWTATASQDGQSVQAKGSLKMAKAQ